MLSLASTQALAYDYTWMRAQESSKHFKTKYKADHAKEHYDTEIIDYYFNFGLGAGAERRSYIAQNDPDFVTGYKTRRLGTFQRKDELGPFPRGEELYVRWKYKRQYFEQHVDLKSLLSGIDFDDSGRLYEAKTGFKIFVKVKGETLFVYTSERSKTRKLLYKSSPQ